MQYYKDPVPWDILQICPEVLVPEELFDRYSPRWNRMGWTQCWQMHQLQGQSLEHKHMQLDISFYNGLQIVDFTLHIKLNHELKIGHVN